MDGNGRWAKSKNHTRLFGYVKGTKKAQWIVKVCSDLKIPYLSLFVLSTENFLFRTQSEILSLQKILQKAFLKNSNLLMKKDIKLNFLGDLSVFSSSLQKLCKDLCEKTKKNSGLNLILALNYGGRQEVLQAFKTLGQKIKNKSFDFQNINEKNISSFFPSSEFPEPDLIIRTGGRFRLSNFYLWSASYSELYFTKTLWPDFGKKDLNLAFKHFKNVKRQYGKVL